MIPRVREAFRTLFDGLSFVRDTRALKRLLVRSKCGAQRTAEGHVCPQVIDRADDEISTHGVPG